MYDTGNYEATLDAVIKMADVAGFPKRKEEAAKRGKLRGLGYTTATSRPAASRRPTSPARSARAPGLYEAGEIRVHPTGSVTVFTGSHSHGQGHETTFAQVVADRLGLQVENVDIVHGDTSKILFGMGTYGSRSIAVGGSAIVKALDKIVAKGKKIAAHLMEASEGDIEYDKGVFKVAGTDKQKTIGEVAFAAYVPHNYPLDKLEPGLNENAFYDPTNFTFPAGSYVCEVEIDPDTGVTKVERFSAVDDFGKIINPMIVEGQVHGGITQGIGQALTENCHYDPESGQLVTGSFGDYSHPARRRRAFVPARHARDAVHPQPARGQGLRRGRCDRRARGGDERHHRRARDQGPADARHRRDGVEGDPRQPESSVRKEQRRTPCTHSNTTAHLRSPTRPSWRARATTPSCSPAARAWCRR